jgi:hypothetical protein
MSKAKLARIVRRLFMALEEDWGGDLDGCENQTGSSQPPGNSPNEWVVSKDRLAWPRSQSPQLRGEALLLSSLLPGELCWGLLRGFKILDDGLGARANMKFLVDCFEIVANCFVAQGQVVGDFFGGHALCKTF